MEKRDVKKKICVVTTDRADYGRLKPVMEAIRKDPHFELQVVVGSHLFFDHLVWYLRHGEPISWWKSFPWHLKARTRAVFARSNEDIFKLEYFTRFLRSEGFPIHARIPMFLEGGNPRVMTKISGLCLLGLPSIFEKLEPDLVLINGDRFEMFPIAFATVSSNIHLAHLEGGDVSGTLDESTRHAITKLAHFHFPATEKSAKRIVAMGENPKHVYVTGSPVIDMVKRLDTSLDNSFYERNSRGGGERIDFTKPFLLGIHHPVTTRYEENRVDSEELIAALDALSMPTIILAPNIDAGSDGVSAAFRAYRDRQPRGVTFFKSFTPQDYYRVFAHAAVAVGNSSSFIREGAFFGTPAIIVGDRQQNRERGKNVFEVIPKKADIVNAIKRQLDHGRYPQDALFGDGKAADRIVKILADLDFSKIPVQKSFHESH